MAAKDDSASKQLDAILSALQKSLLDASDEEIAKELWTVGVDPLKAMEVMNFADQSAVDEHFRRLREQLAKKRVETLRKIEAARGQIPATRAARLDLLRVIYSKHSKTLTAQFREVTSLESASDAELTSMLEHLAVLGYVRLRDG